MVPVSRRSFVAGSAAIPFVLWFEKYARAAYATKPLVRYDARSAQGQAMLKVYAQAVKKMQTTATIPEGSPQGWTFQWYTHSVKGLGGSHSAAEKAAAIAAIYPTPSAWKNLATEMWTTCQAHNGQPEDYFLPWHRMFVYFFEEIIRNVSGHSNFTLPYWNYTKSGPTFAVIPPEFTKSGDATFGSLFVAKRNTGINTGSPIGGTGSINLDSLKQCVYSPSGVVQGFNQTLDFGLHGNVHVGTGNGMNMGSVPWAAGDPVFWAHHCQIDRIWASWNAAGRKNPTNSTFLTKTFVFADGAGNRVEAKIQDFLDIAKLGYAYDHLEPVPACPKIKLSFQAAAAKAALVHSSLKTLALGAGPSRAALDLAPVAGAPKAAAAETFAARLRRMPKSHSVFLVLKGLKADVQPETVYNIYLDLPEGTAPEKGRDHLVGSINFFDAGHGDHEAAGAGTGEPKFVSFDITDLSAKLAAKKGLAAAKLEVTIAPVGQAVSEAKPVIGEISIVEQ